MLNLDAVFFVGSSPNGQWTQGRDHLNLLFQYQRHWSLTCLCWKYWRRQICCVNWVRCRVMCVLSCLLLWKCHSDWMQINFVHGRICATYQEPFSITFVPLVKGEVSVCRSINVNQGQCYLLFPQPGAICRPPSPRLDMWLFESSLIWNQDAASLSWANFNCQKKKKNQSLVEEHQFAF